MEILHNRFGEDGGWSMSRVATWLVSNWMEQGWDDTKVIDAALGFLEWKKKEGAKKNYLDKIDGILDLQNQKKEA